jgi:hypothetical protein
MIRYLAGAIALTALAPAATAQPDSARERVGSVVRCLDIADGPARLACFDSSARDLRQSMQMGELAISEPARQQLHLPLDGHVAAASVTGARTWRIELDNGTVWTTQEPQSARRLPPVGAAVRIEGGLLGNGFWLRLPNGGGRYRLNRG